jgi:phosphate transport system ATP-binding protein
MHVMSADAGPDGRRVSSVYGAAANGVAVLRADGLTLSFGSRAILSDVNVEIQRGSVTALIGPTGSGKTTLLRTFNRMNDKVTGYRHLGDVLLDGRSIWHSGVDLMALRRKVGMLFQRPNPFPMSILDNVVAGVKAHRLAGRHELKAIAKDRLSEVGLWTAVSERLKDSPFRLSGGQQQLLCLARALAIGPEVLLARSGGNGVDRVADPGPRPGPDRRDRHPQPRAGEPGRRPDHLLEQRQAR